MSGWKREEQFFREVVFWVDPEDGQEFLVLTEAPSVLSTFGE